MGLFGFGKKKEARNIVHNKEEKTYLNRRAHERYIAHKLSSSLGDVVDISKYDISIAFVDKKIEIDDMLEVRIANKKFKAKVAALYSQKTALLFEEEMDREIIANHLVHLKKNEKKREIRFSYEKIGHNENMERNKAIINLMLEIDDPNTNIDKFKNNINALGKLREKILNKANSIENARVGRVEDIKGAVSRLGFEEVRKMIYDFVNYDVKFENKILTNFEHFEFYTIFMSGLFKKIAPLFSFKDLKNEGQSLLGMSHIGVEMLVACDPSLNEIYKGPKELFSLEARELERQKLGMDYLEILKEYFVDTLGVYTYLYDGFVLANMMLYPSYTPSFSITLSERKMKFAYVAYITLLAQKFVISKDSYSGYLFFNRIQRVGFSPSEAREFLHTVIDETNEKLSILGIEKKIILPSIPPISYSLEDYTGVGIYTNYLKKSFEMFDTKAKRVAFRYHDMFYAHYVIEKYLQYEEFACKKVPFCIVPSEKLEDEDLMLEQFSAFDILWFKDIDKLPKGLLRDFDKIWRDFEGKIVVSYSYESMIDYNFKELFLLLHPYIVYFPSYFQTPVIYTKMLQHTLYDIESCCGKELCTVDRFKDDYFAQKSVYEECLKQI